MEHQEMAEERLKRAEQQIAKANQQADEATKQLERLTREHQEMADKRLNRAEQAEKMIQKAVECAAQLERKLEQKFMDAMKRIEGNTGMHPERMDMNHRGDNWVEWRSTIAEDEVMDHETVENLLQPQTEIAESSNLMYSERNPPNSTNDDDMGSEDRGSTPERNPPDSTDDDDIGSEDRGFSDVQKGKQKVPPPRKYFRPSGGATSVAISVNQPSPSPEHYQPSPSPSPFQLSTTRPRQHQRKLGKTVQKYSKPIFGEGAEEDFRSSTRPGRTIYPQSPLRGFSTTRAKQLVHLIYIDKLATKIILL